MFGRRHPQPLGSLSAEEVTRHVGRCVITSNPVRLQPLVATFYEYYGSIGKFNVFEGPICTLALRFLGLRTLGLVTTTSRTVSFGTSVGCDVGRHPEPPAEDSSESLGGGEFALPLPPEAP